MSFSFLVKDLMTLSGTVYVIPDVPQAVWNVRLLLHRYRSFIWFHSSFPSLSGQPEPLIGCSLQNLSPSAPFWEIYIHLQASSSWTSHGWVYLANMTASWLGLLAFLWLNSIKIYFIKLEVSLSPHFSCICSIYPQNKQLRVCSLRFPNQRQGGVRVKGTVVYPLLSGWQHNTYDTWELSWGSEYTLNTIELFFPPPQKKTCHGAIYHFACSLNSTYAGGHYFPVSWKGAWSSVIAAFLRSIASVLCSFTAPDEGLGTGGPPGQQRSKISSFQLSWFKN